MGYALTIYHIYFFAKLCFRIASEKKRPIWEVIVETGAQVPDEVWAIVPDDASINYKHYLYGALKKQA